MPLPSDILDLTSSMIASPISNFDAMPCQGAHIHAEWFRIPLKGPGAASLHLYLCELSLSGIGKDGIIMASVFPFLGSRSHRP